MTSIQLEAAGAVLDRITIVLDGIRLYRTGRGRKAALHQGDWTHPSLNEWVSKEHAWARDIVKKEWTAEICRRTRNLEGIRGQVVVTVTTYFRANRRHDSDNYTPKFIMDGLVEAGLIEDDCSDVVVDLRTRLRIDPFHPRTEILIERSGAQGVVGFVRPVQPTLDGLEPDPALSGPGRSGRRRQVDHRRDVEVRPAVPGGTSGARSRTRGPRT